MSNQTQLTQLETEENEWTTRLSSPKSPVRPERAKPEPKPKPHEDCPKCKSTNTSTNNAGSYHCWDCGHSWRGKDY